MKAAVVIRGSQSPVYADFDEPVPGDGQVAVRVTASALSHVTRSRASGAHYSASDHFPFVAGVDGTGLRGDGRRIYFVMPTFPFGALAERCVVDASRCIELPDQLDDIAAAAIAIPGMSSWTACTERARLLKGETVLVNGATGTSGRLAVQIARHLGAGRVIATGRRADALRELAALGADATVLLGDDTATVREQLEAHFRQGVGVVLDYLWGSSAELLLASAARAGADAVPIRFVQIGAMSGSDITLPSAALRSSAIVLMGSGIGSVPMPQLLRSIRDVLDAAATSGLQVRTTARSLREVEAAWVGADSENRVVFTV